MNYTTDIDILVRDAKHLVRQRDLPAAIDLFKKALEQDKRRVDVHEGLATAYFLSDDYAPAIEHFRQMILLDPRPATPLINLGAVYNRMGECGKAIKELRRGIQKDRSRSQAFYNLGLAHRGLNQLSMAASAYREAVRLDPQMAEAHQNLANVFSDMENYQQAIIHYKQALEVRPDFERAQHGLAKAKESVKRAKQAISPFGRLVDQNAPRVKATTVVEREMTEIERFKDRQDVYNLSVDVETITVELLKQIRIDLEPKLLALDRAVAQGAETPTLIFKTHADYQVAVERCVTLRQALKHKLLELQAHEKLINTPDLQVPG